MGDKPLVLSFAVHFKAQFGESLCLVVHRHTGSAADPRLWHAMRWTEGNVWRCVLRSDAPELEGTGFPTLALRYSYCVVPSSVWDQRVPVQSVAALRACVVRAEAGVHVLSIPYARPSRTRPQFTRVAVHDWWDVYDQDVRASLLALACGLHPLLGLEAPSPLSVLAVAGGSACMREIAARFVCGAADDQRADRCVAQALWHPLHAEHELHLVVPRFCGHWRCDNPACRNGLHSRFRAWDAEQYRCDVCDFDLCADCALSAVSCVGNDDENAPEVVAPEPIRATATTAAATEEKE